MSCLFWYIYIYLFLITISNYIYLTEVAGEGGPDLAPQKFFKNFYCPNSLGPHEMQKIS